MLNFTGSTRKRTVNLGNRPNLDRNRFLEQNRANRQERERQRDRERKAAIIIDHVHTFLELSNQAESIASTWLTEFDLTPEILPKTSYEVCVANIRDFTRWSLWCAQFRFVSRFGLRQTLEKSIEVLCFISEAFKSDVTCHLSDFDLTILIRSLNKAKTRGIYHEAYIKGMCSIFHNIRVPIKYPLSVHPALRNLSECTTEHNFEDLLPIAFGINTADSKTQFFLYFATLPPGQLQDVGRYSEILRRCVGESLTEISGFPPAVKISILINMESLFTSKNQEDLVASAQILSVMNFCLTQSDTSINDEMADGPEGHNSKRSPYTLGCFSMHSMDFMDSIVKSNTSNDVSSCTSFFVTYEVMQKLHKLSSLNFISRVVDTLRSRDTRLLVFFLCQLLHVFHDSKASICMVIATIPNLPQWMFEKLSSHPVFIEIKGTAESRDTCAKSAWRELSHIKNIWFWDLLYTYEQFLTYWLIVSKENETFKDRILKAHDIQVFCRFLKTLCLTLIFENTELAHIERVHDLSLALLNQLYMKNLRSRFLEDDFWILKSINFEISHLLPSILADDDFAESDQSSEEELPMSAKYQPPRSDLANKLDLLKRVPFFVDFKDRVKVFQALIEDNKNSLGTNSLFFSDELNSHHVQLNINRKTPFEDCFAELPLSGPDVRNKWKVTFHNEHGPEAGIDGGGLTKELLTLIVHEATKSEQDNGMGLLKETESYELYPSEETYLRHVAGIDVHEQKTNLAYFEFLGMIIGKCLYESVLIDVKFAPFFLAKWKVNQKMKSSMNDLLYVDSNLYHNLNKLLDMPGDELRALDLDFVLNEVIDGKIREFDLLPPGGRDVQVDTSNRLTYVHLVSDFKLNKSLDTQTKNFLAGMFRVIKPNWLNMFDPFELQKLIGGVNDIDMDDWKRNVSYGGYFDDDTTILLFWEVVAEMSSEERCELVKFVTSVARAPLLGFSALYPKFGINNSGSPDRLPTASTCHNLLKLPNYQDKKLLREKLLYALNANSGFDLS